MINENWLEREQAILTRREQAMRSDLMIEFEMIFIYLYERWRLKQKKWKTFLINKIDFRNEAKFSFFFFERFSRRNCKNGRLIVSKLKDRTEESHSLRESNPNERLILLISITTNKDKWFK